MPTACHNGANPARAVSTDTKDYAEAYKTAGYPEVLKILDKVLDGTPKVQVSDVISSTIHKPAAVAA
jgi:hypothetical protein